MDSSFLDPGGDPLACQFAGQNVSVTLAASVSDVYICKDSDVLTDAKRSFIRLQLLPAVVDLCV